MCFYPISKAFNSVDHNILLAKLDKYEVEFILFVKKIFYGIPQGSILGPILFLIDANYLKAFSTELRVTKYANDCSFLVSN